MSDWIPVTPENSNLRDAHEAWAVECPSCGVEGGVQMYGSSRDARGECHDCGATVEFGVRVVNDG